MPRKLNKHPRKRLRRRNHQRNQLALPLTSKFQRNQSHQQLFQLALRINQRNLLKKRSRKMLRVIHQLLRRKRKHQSHQHQLKMRSKKLNRRKLKLLLWKLRLPRRKLIWNKKRQRMRLERRKKMKKRRKLCQK